MNYIKTFLLSALIISGASVNAQEQSTETMDLSNSVQQIQLSPTQKGIKRATKLKSDLSLTESQYEQVKNLFVKVELKIDAVINGDDVPAERKQEFIDGNKKDERFVLKSILTATQWQSYTNL